MANATFTFRIDDTLKAAFTDAAKANDRSGAQLLRDFMRDYVQNQEEQAGYDAWFRRKVAAGLAAVKAGQVSTGDDAEAYFAKRRAASRRQVDETDL